MLLPPQFIGPAKSQLLRIHRCASFESSVSVGIAKSKLAASRFHLSVRPASEITPWALVDCASNARHARPAAVERIMVCVLVVFGVYMCRQDQCRSVICYMQCLG